MIAAAMARYRARYQAAFRLAMPHQERGQWSDFDWRLGKKLVALFSGFCRHVSYAFPRAPQSPAGSAQAHPVGDNYHQFRRPSDIAVGAGWNMNSPKKPRWRAACRAQRPFHGSAVATTAPCFADRLRLLDFRTGGLGVRGSLVDSAAT